MSNKKDSDLLYETEYSFPVVPKLPLNESGGDNMEWQHEYIKNLNDDVREIRSEIQKMRQDFHAELSALRK